MRSILILLFTLVINPQYNYFNIPYRADIGNRVWFMKYGTDSVEVIGMRYDSSAALEEIVLFRRLKCTETDVNGVYQTVLDSLQLNNE